MTINHELQHPDGTKEKFYYSATGGQQTIDGLIVHKTQAETDLKLGQYSLQDSELSKQITEMIRLMSEILNQLP
jgi:hypothetical protein